jgi:pimeloyl-ACP methyl ester carboxylesterase
VRTIRANGVDVCAQTFGDAADPALLLIHGAGSTMLSWDDGLCGRLAAGGRSVIRYDGRGAGRSAGGPFGFGDLVADAAGLLDALAVERAHVLGMSLGGGVAQLIALDRPDRVASLILASSTPGGPGHPQPDLPGAVEGVYDQEPAQPDWSDRDAVVEYLVQAERPYAARSRAYDEPGMRALAERVVDHSSDIEASMNPAFEFDVGDPWRQRLGEVAAPTLVIHGTEDPMFPYAHAVALADEIPGARLLPLERTGHEYFPRETWDVVVPAILRHTAGEPVHP